MDSFWHHLFAWALEPYVIVARAHLIVAFLGGYAVRNAITWTLAGRVRPAQLECRRCRGHDL